MNGAGIVAITPDNVGPTPSERGDGVRSGIVLLHWNGGHWHAGGGTGRGEQQYPVNALSWIPGGRPWAGGSSFPDSNPNGISQAAFLKYGPGRRRPPAPSRAGGPARDGFRCGILRFQLFLAGTGGVSWWGRRPILLPSQTSGSYLRPTTRSFIGMSALSVILMCSGQTSVQHLVMLQ